MHSAYLMESQVTWQWGRIDKASLLLIKESLPIIVPSITSIINASLRSRVFPTSWKIAEVWPILKNGDREEASSYDQFRYTANTF